MAKATLKVGDVVHVLNNRIKTPTPAKIVAITADVGKPVGVEFADAVGAHSCDGAGKHGHCLWVLPEHCLLAKDVEELKKVQEATKVAKPKPAPMVLEIDDGKHVVRPA